jgi:succinate dehydrogenase / fumarate reductase iron-sulfur subunit
MTQTGANTTVAAGQAGTTDATALRIGEKRTVVLRIERCDGPGKSRRWEAFQVPVTRGDGANVISCLQWIASNPTTMEGRATTPVVWDSGCLEEVCGACTIVINGAARQSCSCLIDTIAPLDGNEIRLQPMSKFPVVRDLWVDRSRMFSNLKRVQAWSPIDGLYALGAGPQEDRKQQQTRYAISECMTCGCCLEACPQFTLVEEERQWDSTFVGANAIGQAHLFNLHRTGGQLADERMETLLGPGGVSDCGNAQNCVKVCPKHIPLTEAIAAIGRAATIHGLKRFFGG